MDRDIKHTHGGTEAFLGIGLGEEVMLIFSPDVSYFPNIEAAVEWAQRSGVKLINHKTVEDWLRWRMKAQGTQAPATS